MSLIRKLEDIFTKEKPKPVAAARPRKQSPSSVANKFDATEDFFLFTIKPEAKEEPPRFVVQTGKDQLYSFESVEFETILPSLPDEEEDEEEKEYEICEEYELNSSDDIPVYNLEAFDEADEEIKKQEKHLQMRKPYVPYAEDDILESDFDIDSEAETTQEFNLIMQDEASEESVVDTTTEVFQTEFELNSNEAIPALELETFARFTEKEIHPAFDTIELAPIALEIETTHTAQMIVEEVKAKAVSMMAVKSEIILRSSFRTIDKHFTQRKWTSQKHTLGKNIAKVKTKKLNMGINVSNHIEALSHIFSSKMNSSQFIKENISVLEKSKTVCLIFSLNQNDININLDHLQKELVKESIDLQIFDTDTEDVRFEITVPRNKSYKEIDLHSMKGSIHELAR